MPTKDELRAEYEELTGENAPSDILKEDLLALVEEARAEQPEEEGGSDVPGRDLAEEVVGETSRLIENDAYGRRRAKLMTGDDLINHCVEVNGHVFTLAQLIGQVEFHQRRK